MEAFKSKHTLGLLLLAGLLLVCFFFSISLGAISISIQDILSTIQGKMNLDEELPLIQRIFFDIRLPRAMTCIVVGASLAMSGVLMQALFRNPIVEPGLIGTSSGAAFGASLYFVLGASIGFPVGEWALPVTAFLGGMCSTGLVFILAQNKTHGRSSVVSLLLTGIAINAIFLSAVGCISYLARDPQARSITFWNLGTVSGANWQSFTVIAFSTMLCFLLSRRFTKHLNGLMMGEEEAFFIGIDIRKLKIIIITINVILVAVATAFVGVISFVGLVVPHLLRLVYGSDNRFLLLSSALPIGIVTSLVGVPVFIYMLRRSTYYF
jgi:iron complex transport system permease protein